MENFHLVVWAVVPPLGLLLYYYRRVPAVPLFRLLLFFGVGAISGFVALGLEWGFEYVANWIGDWEGLTRRSLLGVALRQLVEVGPIEEGSKFCGVVLIQRWHRRTQLTTTLATIAVALGFTAEENWIYLFNQTATILDRLIGTPVHVLFSAPWGYALAVASSSGLGVERGVMVAITKAITAHALVNVLSSAARYPALSFLSYGLFPFLLWLFWRLEQLWRKAQGKSPLALISGRRRYCYWQRGLVLFTLMLGGNAIFGLFLLARSLSFLSSSELFSPVVWYFIVSRCLLNLIPALIAWGIYRYLRASTQQ